MTTQSSLSSFTAIRPSLSRRQKEVLEAIRALGGRATMHEVAARLGIPLNAISGRFTELVKKGKIDEWGTESKIGRQPRTVYEAKEGTK